MEDVKRDSWYCPSCSSPIKVLRPDELVVCVFCDQLVTPIPLSLVKPKPNPLLMEGVKTPVTIASFMNRYFETIDWKTFALNPLEHTIEEIDELIHSSMAIQDYLTWVNVFTSIYIPVLKKLEGLHSHVNKITAIYLKDGETKEICSLFNQCQSVITYLDNHYSTIQQSLMDAYENAKHYGCTRKESIRLYENLSDLNKKWSEIICPIHSMEDLSSIKREQAIRNEELAQKFGDIEAIYSHGNRCFQQKELKKAIQYWTQISGYKDTTLFIKRYNHYQSQNLPMIEMGLQTYYLEMYETFTKKGTSYRLIPVIQGKLSNRELIDDIKKPLTFYEGCFYYISNHRTIQSFEVETKRKKVIDRKGGYVPDKIFQNGTKIYFLQTKSKNRRKAHRSPNPYQLLFIDVATNKLKVIYREVTKLENFVNHQLLFTSFPPAKLSWETRKEALMVLDTKTNASWIVLDDQSLFKGLLDESHIAYIKKSGASDNFDLYTKSYSINGIEQMVEHNIYDVCKTSQDKIYYLVGNKTNQSLLSVKFDGSNRQLMSKVNKKIVHADRNNVFIEEKDDYNSALIRLQNGGTLRNGVTKHFQKIILIEGEYVYYLDDRNCLCRVKLTGKHQQPLETHFKELILIKDNWIYFTAKDSDSIPNETLSLYALTLDGHSKKKLIFNVSSCRYTSGNKIDYFKLNGEGRLVFYHLSCQTGQSTPIVSIEKIEDQRKCFIVYLYGSHLAPEVVFLRNYRDKVLKQSLLGIFIILIYWLLNPILYGWLRKNRLFVKCAHRYLNQKIKKVKTKYHL